MKKKPIKSKKAEKPYKVILTLKDSGVYESEGDTILEALKGITINSTDIKTMGNLVISFGDKKVERMINSPRIARMFGSKAGNLIKKIALSTYSKFLMTGLC